MVKDVIWAEPAQEDLESIFDFHKKKSEKYAYDLKSKLLDAPDILMLPNVISEEIGQIELTLVHLGQGHRYLIEGHYKIIYFLESNYAYVTHVFDTRQDPDKKLR